jgi:hypothetical protein
MCLRDDDSPLLEFCFYIYFSHFAKLYDRLKIYQIWQSTLVRHGRRRGPQCLRPNRHGARQLAAGHGCWT